jgi:predicted  nucleic acid-binding Zn-ribbon protein
MDRERDKRSFIKGSFMKIGSKLNSKLQNLQKRHQSTSKQITGVSESQENSENSTAADAEDVNSNGKFVIISKSYIFCQSKIT